MPVYDYLCPDCGPITAQRPMSAHAEPIECPACKQEAPRAILRAPFMSGLSTERRTAFETNERASHAPKHSTKDSREAAASEGRKKRHPSGCSCCSGSTNIRSSAVYRPDGSKTFPSKRPWMISH